MATRTTLLNGNVINRDTDFSKHIEAVSEPGVISGLAVSSSAVAVGEAFVKCERTNGDTIYALVYNTASQSISGDGDVYIEIPQELINNGELANEDGTEIAEIKVGTMPDKNALKLAVKSGSTITDSRNMIHKVGELNQVFEDLTDLDTRVDALEEAGAISHLEDSGLVGENYVNLSGYLFSQNTPALSDCAIDCAIGSASSNTEVHIQRIASGTASNKLNLKVKAVGSPTTGLVVEVREGVEVDVSTTEAYWYGNTLVCSGSISAASITSSYQEIEVTMGAEFGGTKGELLDIVVYQTGSVVNASNYYTVACDTTQYSEGFSYVAVNGTTRTRSKLMPYCISGGIASSMICKLKSSDLSLGSKSQIYTCSGSNPDSGTSWQRDDKIGEIDITSGGELEIVWATTFKTNSAGAYQDKNVYVSMDGTIIQRYYSVDNTTGGTFTVALPNGAHHLEIHLVGGRNNSSSYGYWNSATCTLSLTPKILGSSARAGIPVELKSLGEFTTINIFGTSNGKFFAGAEVNSVTTGSITPGDFVGYIQVGEYKIPYYK